MGHVKFSAAGSSNLFLTFMFILKRPFLEYLYR
jgi:hypothetical protein